MITTEFMEAVRESVAEKVKGKVAVNEVVKNNGLTLHGLTILSEGTNISPTIYLENYVGIYENGKSVEEITDEIVRCLEENRVTDGFDIESFLDFEKVKRNIVYKIINYEANRELLKDVPHKKYLDLAKVFYVLIEMDEKGSGTILIHNSHMNIWGVESGELEEIAEKNTKAILGCQMLKMGDILKEMIPDDTELNLFEDSMEPEMYVVSNFQKMYGAGVIFDKEFMRKTAEELESDLIILPSSLHECILLKRMGDESDKMRDMVKEVNDSQVDLEEQLSNNVYLYSRENEEISIL